MGTMRHNSCRTSHALWTGFYPTTRLDVGPHRNRKIRCRQPLQVDLIFRAFSGGRRDPLNAFLAAIQSGVGIGGIADDVASRLVTNDHAVTRDLALLFEDFDQTAQGHVRSFDDSGSVVPAADSTRIGHPHETCRHQRLLHASNPEIP